jgi:hypothetical protein
MLKESDIDIIVQRVASANLASDSIVSVISSPTVDPVGDPALRIRITVTPESTAAKRGCCVEDAARDPSPFARAGRGSLPDYRIRYTGRG